MSSFDPPTGPPLSEEPVRHGRRRRYGRVAVVALMSVGLLGVGVAVAGQIDPVNRQGVASAAVGAPDAPRLDNVVDAFVPDDDEREATDPERTVVDQSTDVSGRIEVDVGDGDPIVIELDEFDGAVVGELGECLGLPSFDLHVGGGPLTPGGLPDDLGTWLDDWSSQSDRPDWWHAEHDLDTFLDDVFAEWDVQVGTNHEGDLGSTFDDLFAEFGATTDGQVTVSGPDGVSVIDIGEDGSVTITRDGDDITIVTTGDATVSDLDDLDDLDDLGDLVGDIGTLFDQFETSGELNLDDELQRRIDEMLEGVPAADELPEFGSVDPTEIQRCIDDALGR